MYKYYIHTYTLCMFLTCRNPLTSGNIGFLYRFDEAGLAAARVAAGVMGRLVIGVLVAEEALPSCPW